VEANFDAFHQFVSVRLPDMDTTPNPDGSIAMEGDGIPPGMTREDVLLIITNYDGRRSFAVVSSVAFEETEPEIFQVYAACEAEYPDFRQPEPLRFDETDTAEHQRRIEEATLAFSQCAREEGFTRVGDPTDAQGGAVIPADMTEGEFRALLDACAVTAENAGGAIRAVGIVLEWEGTVPGFAWAITPAYPSIVGTITSTS
jgi:hypothetical protein